MIRHGLIAMLGVLVLAAPAWAAGEKATPFVVMPNGAIVPRPTTTVLPASSPFAVVTKPFAVTSSGAIVPNPALTAVPMVPDHRRRPATTTIVTAPAPQVIVVQQPVYYYYPQTVAAAPSECVTQGFWSYRWIPYTTTQNVWVSGSWTADGSWTDSHWESRPYSSGYYEPFWTPGQQGC